MPLYPSLHPPPPFVLLPSSIPFSSGRRGGEVRAEERVRGGVVARLGVEGGAGRRDEREGAAGAMGEVCEGGGKEEYEGGGLWRRGRKMSVQVEVESER